MPSQLCSQICSFMHFLNFVSYLDAFKALYRRMLQEYGWSSCAQPNQYFQQSFTCWSMLLGYWKPAIPILSANLGAPASATQQTGPVGMQVIRELLQKSRLSEGIVDVIMPSWRSSTHKQYTVYINGWLYLTALLSPLANIPWCFSTIIKVYSIKTVRLWPVKVLDYL